MSNANYDKEPKFILIVKDVWDTIPGKIGISAVSGLFAMLIVGIGFKAAAYTMNCFKDYRDAARR